MNSLHSLSSAELQALGSHQLGSHALQALVTTCSDKGKGKILRKMEVWLLFCVFEDTPESLFNITVVILGCACSVAFLFWQ